LGYFVYNEVIRIFVVINGKLQAFFDMET